MGVGLQSHHTAHAVPHQNSLFNLGGIQHGFERCGQTFKTQGAVQLASAIAWHVPCQGSKTMICKKINRRLEAFFAAPNAVQKDHGGFGMGRPRFDPSRAEVTHDAALSNTALTNSPSCTTI